MVTDRAWSVDGANYQPSPVAAYLPFAHASSKLTRLNGGTSARLSDVSNSKPLAISARVTPAFRLGHKRFRAIAMLVRPLAVADFVHFMIEATVPGATMGVRSRRKA